MTTLTVMSSVPVGVPEPTGVGGGDVTSGGQGALVPVSELVSGSALFVMIHDLRGMACETADGRSGGDHIRLDDLRI